MSLHPVQIRWTNATVLLLIHPLQLQILLSFSGHYLSKERSDRQKRLTRLGREQLELTGRRLREVGFEYDAIVSSTMTRAKESANIIVDQLRECRSHDEGKLI